VHRPRDKRRNRLVEKRKHEMRARGSRHLTPSEILAGLKSSEWFEIGKESAKAYLDRKTWLYRRVESIEFVGRHSLRRHVSIDFEGPKHPNQLPDLKGRGPVDGRLVPLSVFLKWPPLMDFDFRGPQGEPLSLYKRSTNKQLDFGLLMGMVEILSVRLDDVLEERLALLVAVNTPPDARLEEIIGQLQSVLALSGPAGIQGEGPSIDAHRVHAEYVADTANLASQLANSSVLWAPLTTREGCDSIVKFSYLDKHELAQRRGLRQLLISCSWQDRVLYIPLPHGGQHTRYHVDVRRPQSGVEFLRVQTLAFPAMPRAVAPETLSESMSVDKVEEHASAAERSNHGGTPELAPGQLEDDPANNRPSAEIVDRRIHIYHPARSAPSHRAYMVLVIAATREGFISQCALVAFALAALMTVSYADLRASAENLAGFVVLLAAIPLVLGYLLIRSEDSLEREGIIGVRALAVLSGVLPIAGGLMLVFKHPLQPGSHTVDLGVTRPQWAALALASWMVTLGLFWSAGMAVSPRDAVRRFRINNIAATSGGLCAASLVVANILLSQPFSNPGQRAGFVLDNRALVIVASAFTLVAASALHGLIETIRRLALPRRDEYTPRQDARTFGDRVASIALMGAGELWILSMTGAALLTLWQAMTLERRTAGTTALDIADHLIDIALVPCFLSMVVASVWLVRRKKRLLGDRHQLTAGLLAGGIAVALRALSLIVPGVEVQPRVAWLGFAVWLWFAIATIRIPQPGRPSRRVDVGTSATTVSVSGSRLVGTTDLL
jgi:hypothetical protein